MGAGTRPKSASNAASSPLNKVSIGHPMQRPTPQRPALCITLLYFTSRDIQFQLVSKKNLRFAKIPTRPRVYEEGRFLP